METQRTEPLFSPTSRNFQEALNYEALIYTSGKGEATIEPLFDKLGQCLDLSVPLPSHPHTYADAIGVPPSILLEGYYHAHARFQRLSTTDVVIKRGDPLFPQAAAVVAHAPRFLYVRGDLSLLSRRLVCVVGTRNPSDEGKQFARESSLALGAAGLVVISGLALGIDGVAHLTALAQGFPTVAVIGTSLIESYPPEHASLQSRICAEGLVVTRFSPVAKTQKWFFLLRNQLMSSLSIASVLVEDRDGGGAVKQAQYALAQQRTVLLFKHTLENRSILWPRRLAADPLTVVVGKPAEIPKLLGIHPQPPKPNAVKEDKNQLSLF
ncbi:MAG: DNA-processing protein DprA [Spirochaetae bacterium HGW-Spirochaetae-8]|nr:MAG: DNA-processing protein DprA [Spirochaetae bacterium HGW-Spirochaetae-8]